MQARPTEYAREIERIVDEAIAAFRGRAGRPLPASRDWFVAFAVTVLDAAARHGWGPR